MDFYGLILYGLSEINIRILILKYIPWAPQDE